ncbi:MAG: IPT/TIG domain-containing protein, partial [Acidobacteria bacterium]|nr:IPT/TIG domain-containing protein [Acidobacteriota bacterium]
SVVITGIGFGTVQGSSTVTFNGMVAQVSAWSATSITAIVPAKATSGLVIVTANGAQANGVTFKIGGKLGPPSSPRLAG